MKQDLKNDIFIIPSKENRHIVYSPMRGVAFNASNKAVEIINDYLKSNIFPIEYENTDLSDYLQKLENMDVKQSDTKHTVDISDKALFILSQMCNLSCSYCYAKESRSQEILSKEKIKTVVDYIYSVNKENTKTFSFIGGGEPAITWDLLEWAISYIKDKTKKNGIKAGIGITTNGTLLNDEKILWLKKMNVSLCISFDILPEIQNIQRGFSNELLNSFDIVEKNIKNLLSNDICFKIRSTITNKNVDLMPDMVKFVIENYPQIKQLHFEPVADIINNGDLYYNKFVKYFFEAYNIGLENKIFVCNSIINSFFRIRKQFCVGELCVTPLGDIVSCHRHSTEKDIEFSSFYYGSVEDNGISINEEKFNHIVTIRESRYSDCETCFAKWHCAGGCTSIRKSLSREQQMSYCRFIKNMLTNFLEYKLFKKEGGVNYEQFEC